MIMEEDMRKLVLFVMLALSLFYAGYRHIESENRPELLIMQEK